MGGQLVDHSRADIPYLPSLMSKWLPYARRRDAALTSDRMATLYDALAPRRDRWMRRNRYYYRAMADYCRFVIPPGSSVLEIGCGTGDLLAALAPHRGVGIDVSPEMVERAAAKHPDLEFRVGDAESLELDETFDYVVLSDVVGLLFDIQRAFDELHKVVDARTRIVVTYQNFLWEPLLNIGEALRLKMKVPHQNWLSAEDIENLLYLTGFETVNKGYRLLLPKWIPLVSHLVNRYAARLPGIRRLCLSHVLVARPLPPAATGGLPSCSVIVPCRNEKGNVEQAVIRTPAMGSHTELVFVEGGSQDGTAEEIERVIAAYPDRDIKLVPQGGGKGKGDAVRRGFASASGDVLMILDGDLTVVPEDLPRFFAALVEGKGELINGTRLVYPMERQAMRLLNLIGNKLFSLAFTYLLEQRIRDTLCGTKVLYARDYDRVANGRTYFGDFDPFGDFDLLFGAAKLQLRITEVPVRYRERSYGSTQIQRFRHGWLLLKMTAMAMRKIKFV